MILLQSSSSHHAVFGLARLIDQISLRYELHFRTCVASKELEPYLTSCHVKTIQSYFGNCTQTLESSLGSRESQFFKETRKLSPNLKLFFLFPSQSIDSLHYLITRSGYGMDSSFRVLFYVLVEKFDNFFDAFNDPNDIPEPRFMCPLVFLEATKGHIKSGHILCYTCHEKNRFSRVDMINDPARLIDLHVRLNSNGHAGTIKVHQLSEKIPTPKEIQENPRLTICEKYFSSEPQCGIGFFLILWLAMEKLNISRADGKSLRTSAYPKFILYLLRGK